MLLGRESRANHDPIPKKKTKSSTFVHVKAFPMYGGMGVSIPSLNRESLMREEEHRDSLHV